MTAEDRKAEGRGSGVVSLSCQVVQPEHVLGRELEGETVLLNLETERYYGLDEVGTRMLAVLRNSMSIGTALEQLCQEYDADPAQLGLDLVGLVEQLADRGLVELRAV